MEIKLEPRYRNYWLDLARREQKEKEEAERKKALVNLVNTIQNLHSNKKP